MAVLLDLDGTLVDSVFHHVITWAEALHDAGHDVPLWRIHDGIGMGGERLLPWLLGGHVPEASDISDDHKRRFLERAGDLKATRGARELIEDLRIREVPFIVATSAGSAEREAMMKALGCGELPTTDSDEVDAPKPAPDLLLAACEKIGVEPQQAMLVGDSPWDGYAAGRVGIRMIGVRTGGFSLEALRAAGAIDVVDDPLGLVGRL
jgi:HAD superfamily hydrolase (TIGR01509 family)